MSHTHTHTHTSHMSHAHMSHTTHNTQLWLTTFSHICPLGVCVHGWSPMSVWALQSFFYQIPEVLSLESWVSSWMTLVKDVYIRQDRPWDSLNPRRSLQPQHPAVICLNRRNPFRGLRSGPPVCEAPWEPTGGTTCRRRFPSQGGTSYNVCFPHQKGRFLPFFSSCYWVLCGTGAQQSTLKETQEYSRSLLHSRRNTTVWGCVCAGGWLKGDILCKWECPPRCMITRSVYQPTLVDCTVPTGKLI